MLAEAWDQRAELAGVTWKLSLGGREFYLMLVDSPASLGPAEISLRGARLGSELYGNWTAIARSLNLALRAGAPLADVCTELAGVTSDPRGLVTGHPRITWADSLADLVALALFDRYVRPLLEVVTMLGGPR